MLIGVLSDTHDRVERTQRAVEMLIAEGATHLVHCGDLTGVEIVQICAALPCWYVFGNNDADMTPHLERAMIGSGGACLGWGGCFELSGKRLGVVHGHLTSDLKRVLVDEPAYLFSGHSHLTHDSGPSPLRRINPGALHRAKVHTVALLDLSRDAVRFLTVK